LKVLGFRQKNKQFQFKIDIIKPFFLQRLVLSAVEVLVLSAVEVLVLSAVEVLVLSAVEVNGLVSLPPIKTNNNK
jgi:hypothetical protein